MLMNGARHGDSDGGGRASSRACSANALAFTAPLGQKPPWANGYATRCERTVAMYPCIATAAAMTTTLPERKAARRPASPKWRYARSANSADGSSIIDCEYCRMSEHVNCMSTAHTMLSTRHSNHPACWKVYGITRRVDPIMVFHSVKTMPTEPALVSCASPSSAANSAPGSIGLSSRPAFTDMLPSSEAVFDGNAAPAVELVPSLSSSRGALLVFPRRIFVSLASVRTSKARRSRQPQSTPLSDFSEHVSVSNGQDRGGGY